jgi:glutamyl-tRNA reductase
MSALAARYLHAAQVRQLWIANRTLARAQSLAAECGGTAISLENIDDTLKQCDVVFTATSAPEAILTYQRIAAIMTERQRPLCLVDLALPRNIDPCVATIPQITLIDLDGLQALAAQNLAQRRAEMDKVRVIIAYEVDTFWRWCLSRNVTPTISALRQHAEQIRQSELNDHGGRLRALSAHERKVIESMTASIIGRLLHEPTLRLKARASAGDGVQYAAMLRELFALDETENK